MHVRQAGSHAAKAVQANHKARPLATGATIAYVQNHNKSYAIAADLYNMHLMASFIKQLT